MTKQFSEVFLKQGDNGTPSNDAIGKAVQRGMAIAAGVAMDPFGQDVVAQEILGAAGLTTIDKLRAAEVDDYDISKLKPCLDYFKGKARLKKFKQRSVSGVSA